MARRQRSPYPVSPPAVQPHRWVFLLLLVLVAVAVGVLVVYLLINPPGSLR